MAAEATAQRAQGGSVDLDGWRHAARRRLGGSIPAAEANAVAAQDRDAKNGPARKIPRPGAAAIPRDADVDFPRLQGFPPNSRVYSRGARVNPIHPATMTRMMIHSSSTQATPEPKQGTSYGKRAVAALRGSALIQALKDK